MKCRPDFHLSAKERHLSGGYGIYTYLICISCFSEDAEGAKNVSGPWISLHRGWDNLTMTFLGKFGYNIVLIYISFTIILMFLLADMVP